jgi:hypothetical protein
VKVGVEPGEHRAGLLATCIGGEGREEDGEGGRDLRWDGMMG